MSFQALLDGLRSEARVDDVVLAMPTSESTQAVARALVSAGLETRSGVTVVALGQTAGRGRRGRSWSSPVGRGVYATVVRSCTSERLAEVPLLAGIGLCEGLQELGAPVRLKWPNDLLLDGRKLGGILIESIGKSGRDRCVLVGFGVNLSHRRCDLPRPDATSLVLSGLDVPPVAGALAVLVAALDRALGRGAVGGYASERFQELAVHRSGDRMTVAVDGDRLRGVYRGLEPDGRLVLETPERRLRLSSAEVVRVEGGERCWS